MNYKNAFKCHKCPESSNENGCPAWSEVLLTNETGEVKSQNACVFQNMQFMLIEVLKSAGKPAAEMALMRQNMAEGMTKLVGAVEKLPNLLAFQNSTEEDTGAQ